MNLCIKTFVFSLVYSVVLAHEAMTEGIPEPALILHGSVTNTAGSLLLTLSAVNWTVVGSSSSASVSSTIASVNGQFFYFARIPFETRFAGSLTFTPSSNTLPLTATPVTFTRSATVNGAVATLVSPASTNFTFSKADRGRVERVDLVVDMAVDPGLDSDGDGVSDWAEGMAGTDPKDPGSVFKASTDLGPAPGGGLVIKWSSVVGKSYSVERSSDLGQGFQTLAGQIPSAGSITEFRDSTATGQGPYFYRVRVIP